GEAAKGLYDFIWGDFCDWYIELVKSRLWQDNTSPPRLVAQQTLAYVLEGILKLLHPFMPHITEEIWHTLTQKNNQSLALQAYPIADSNIIDRELEKSFEHLIAAIRTIRNLKAEAEIKPGVKVPVILQTENEAERQILHAGQIYIQDVAKVESLTLTPRLAEEPGQAIAGVVGTIQVLIPLKGIVDIGVLRGKLEKSLSKVEAEAKTLTNRLNNPNFVNKAPAEVVQSTQDALAEAQKQLEILQERLQRLK
ncbi:MAG: class I tRNA ligase family protein, partial [Brasilonema sp.]